MRRVVGGLLVHLGVAPSLLHVSRVRIHVRLHPSLPHKKSMECSIHVVIKKSDEVVFESSKTASEMKEKNIPQKELQTDSEPLPMLKEGPLYHLTTAIDVSFERLFLISRK